MYTQSTPSNKKTGSNKCFISLLSKEGRGTQSSWCEKYDTNMSPPIMVVVVMVIIVVVVLDTV